MRGFLSVLGFLVVGSILFASCLNSEPYVDEFAEQWKMDTTTIGIYVRTNNLPVRKDVSGVYFNITQPGFGFPPKISSEVRFGYKLSVIGSSSIIDEDNDATAELEDLVPGMQVGLSLMTPGSKAIIYVPSGYGYGGTNLPGIPSNSNLKFEVELISVTVKPAELTQLAADTVALDQYLETNEIENVIKDTTGLRYVITTPGTGTTATLYDKVRLNYTGKVLTTGATFFSGSNGPTEIFSSRVINYIYAFQAGLTKMKPGTKATLYVPSVLGFGNQAATGAGGLIIPANSNLIYEIELVEIIEE